MNLLNDKIVQAICWTLLHSLWQGLIVALVTGLVMVLSKKSSSGLRYKLLAGIFIGFVVTACITFSHELKVAAVHTIAPAAINNNVAPVFGNNNNYYLAQISTSTGYQHYIKSFVSYFNEHASLIVMVWFIIFLAKSVKILSGLVYIQRIRHYKTNDAPISWQQKINALANRLGITRYILLLESGIVKVPVVVGFLKPTVLVPIGLLTNLSPQEVESILVHELAHIRRKDYLFNLLQCFIDVVFFFNPAIIWISSLIRNERENCCDDIAIKETKSKKQFIQALVSFHQYNTTGSKYAMSFAAKQNKLVNRVKRIVNNKNYTLNPAEKIALVSGMVILSIAFITITNGQTFTPKKHVNKATTEAATTDDNPDSDTTKVKNKVKDKVDGQKENDNTGSANDNNDDNSKHLDAADYYSELQALGCKNVSVDELIDLRNHGVTIDFIKELNQAGYKNLTLKQLTDLRDRGLNTEFLNSLSKLGYSNVPLDKVEELRDHGVNADFIKAFRDLGYSNMTIDEAIELRDHGVNPEFATEWKNAGFANLTLDKMREMRDQGVSPEFIKQMRDAGLTNLTIDEAIELRNHGVNAEYISGLKSIGSININVDIKVDKIQDLKDHGVSVEYIKQMRDAGFTKLTADEAMELKDHGVNPEYVAGLKSLGYTNLSADKIQDLKDHGVSADYIKSFQQIGFKITLEQATDLKDHGVDPKFISSIQNLGFKDISLEKAQELKDHSVDAAFIEKWQKKTGHTFTLNEYISLKDNF